VLPDAYDKLRVARHEIGHALVAIRFGIDFTKIDLFESGSKLGGLQVVLGQKKQTDGYVSMLLAGLICEMLCYNDHRINMVPDFEYLISDSYLGSSNDYDQACDLVWDMMDDSKADAYLLSIWHDVVIYLKSKIGLIIELADVLVQKNELSKSEIEAFLSANAK